MAYQNDCIHVGLAAFGMSGKVFHAPLITAHRGFNLHTILQRSQQYAQEGKLNTQLHGLHFDGGFETLPGSYLGFYDNVYAAIRENETLQVKPEQAMRTIAVIEAAQLSHRQQRVVSLETPP